MRNADFDGHKQVIGSPVTKGTQMNPENLYMAVQRYFDVPRYSDEDFMTRAEDFAERIGWDFYVESDPDKPESETQLASRSILFYMPNERGQYVWITVTEDDLPVYEKVMNGDKEVNRKLLLEKGLLTEPVAVVEQRQQEGQASLERYIQEQNGERILMVLNGLNSSTIKELPPALLVEALEVMCENPRAIAQVWDKDNLQFRTITTTGIDWIDRDLEEFNAARYQLESLQKKVDTTVVDTLVDAAASSGNVADQRRIGKLLTQIATSATYKNSHLVQSYDQLVPSILRFTVDPRLDQTTRASVLKEFLGSYGIEMANHWHELQNSERELLAQAQQEYPTAFQDILKAADRPIQVEPVPGVPRSYIMHPNDEALLEHLARQEASGVKPIATILAEIGRPIEGLIQKTGINREEMQHDEYVTERDVTFDGVVKVSGLLRLGRRYRDHRKVAKAISDLVVEIADKIPADTPIRIIRGSFPGLLAGDLTTALFRNPRITDELRERIITCDFNQQDVTFDDSPMLF